MPILQTEAQKARDEQIINFLGRARGISEQPQLFPQFSTVPGQSADTLQAQNLLRERALGGSGLERLAGETLAGTARGDFLDPFANPAFQQLTDRITGDVGRSVNARFAGANRLGSQARSEALGRGISEGIAPLAFQQFSDERSRQLNAARQLPAIAQLDFQNIGQLGGLGQQQDVRSAALLQDQLDRFNFAQGEPGQRLRTFGANLGIGASPGLVQPDVQSNSLLQGFGTATGAANTLFGAGSLFGGSEGIFGDLFS